MISLILIKKLIRLPYSENKYLNLLKEEIQADIHKDYIYIYIY